MKTILTLIFGLSTLINNAQGITNDYLLGRWEQEDKRNFIMYFSVDFRGELCTKIISAATGNEIKVISAKIEDGKFYLNTVNENIDWYAYSTYTKIDQNTMAVNVKNEYGLYRLIYKRKKL